MRQVVTLFWQILIYPVLYFPYQWLNTTVLVKKFGCGCPVVSTEGEQILRSFNANTITNYVWTGIFILVLLISLLQMRKIIGWRARVYYIGGIAVVSLLLTAGFIEGMKWA